MLKRIKLPNFFAEMPEAMADKKLVLSEAEGFLPPNPLPFCPPERNFSKFSVRPRRKAFGFQRGKIFAEKSSTYAKASVDKSDFVQKTQPFLVFASILIR
mgnify:CR=1 FL=1